MLMVRTAAKPPVIPRLGLGEGMSATVENRTEQIEAQLKTLPAKPGVYLFRGPKDAVLYVGKAKTLRPRVRSYFRGGDARRGLENMTSRVERIEVIVTSTETEAFHLEQNLIRRHRPPFNVRLRDDKSYPYIAVTVDDDYPRVMFTRERHRRGVVYFGPYANAKKVRETLDVLNRVFAYRPCEGPQPGRHSGIPCLDYHIDRCLAPCVGYVSKDDYREIIERVIEFLSGETRPILRELEGKMRVAAEAQDFEAAARYRNRLYSVRHLAERQAADKRAIGTVDVIGIAVGEGGAAVQVFPLRGGRVSPPRGGGGPASPIATASFSRTWQGRTSTRCSRRSPSSTTGARRASRRRSSSRPRLARRPRSPSSSRRSAVPRSRCVPRSEARSGACRSWRIRTPSSHWSTTPRRPSASGCGASRRSRSFARP